MTNTKSRSPAGLRRSDDNIRASMGRGRQRLSTMAAEVISPRSEPATVSSPGGSRTSLPPLLISPPSKAKLERASSYLNKRLSTFSNASNAQSNRSRPQSTAFPIFHSSLPYSLVRDFAYGPLQPLFYGPLPEQPSTISTPASEVSRRLSDPPAIPWHSERGGWSASGREPGEQLPQTSYADGPPYSEDEDIHSPVVTSHTIRHKKHKSNIVNFDQTRGRRGYHEDVRRGHYAGAGGGEGQGYQSAEADEVASGHGGEYITYPPDQSSTLRVADDVSRRDSHFAATLPPRTYTNDDGPPYGSDEDMSEPDDMPDESRFSRDYQFTIASPAEEMHGKALALFDFESENDNELPLVEGQIILVSYRHGQGWLVAQDPKTGESGLVPEEYVRLLRDIEGGLNGIMNGAGAMQSDVGAGEGLMSPVSGPEAKTPTQAEHKTYPPTISTFSTSTKDLEPYPKELLTTGTTADAEPGTHAKPQESMEGVEASGASSEPPNRTQSRSGKP